MIDEHSLRVMRSLEISELAALGPGDVEAFEVIVQKKNHDQGRVDAFLRETGVKHTRREDEHAWVYLFNGFGAAFHFKMQCG
jgi:hypothetical protein